MALLRFTILGCGSSGGVPRLGGNWGACDPTNPKNFRRRCSMLVERHHNDAVTRVLIDTSPDLRSQLLDANIGNLDAVIYTHPHADHIHGIDDLRMIVFNQKARLPVWADKPTSERLLSGFSYAFDQPEGSPYPPILDLNRIDGPVTIDGSAGEITFEPFAVRHGSIDSLGFRIDKLVYLPDVSDMTDEAWRAVEGIDVWILDALRYEPHPTHTHFQQSLDWIKRAGAKRGILTNMHIDLDHQTVQDTTPSNVDAAFDGMTIDMTVR